MVSRIFRRFDIHLVTLDPTLGSEIKKKRPCLIVSPDEINRRLRTVVVLPMTSKGRSYPSRVACTFQGTDGLIVLDQVRTVDKSQLVKLLGTLDFETQQQVADRLRIFFSE